MVNTPFRHATDCTRKPYCGCMAILPDRLGIYREAYMSPGPNRAERRRAKRAKRGLPVSKPAVKRQF